jgi:hypothetical protein
VLVTPSGISPLDRNNPSAGWRCRWQAEELRKAAEAEKRDINQALEDAKTHLRDAGGHVVREEVALRQAMLADVSRLEA